MTLRMSEAPAAATEHGPESTYLVTRVPGEAWVAGVPLRDQRDWGAHASFMETLQREGFVSLGGPLEREGVVVLVVGAHNEAEARRRLAADPWSTADLLRIDRVERWTVLLGDLPGRVAADDPS